MYGKSPFIKNPGYKFIAPAIILLMLIFVYPVFKLIQISFSKVSLATFRPIEWIGFSNYWDILSMRNFLQILINTFIFTTGSVAGQVGLGFIVALLLNRKIKGITFFRMVIMLPYMTPCVVIAAIWVFFYDPEFGLFNLIFIETFRGEKISMLSSSNTVLPAIILVNIWFLFPFSAMVILAGLQGISEEIYAAAKVDGASRFQLFRYITLPSLRPVLKLLIILQGIWAINAFTLIWVMTEGGPGYSSTLLGILSYELSFGYLDFEKGAAAAIILVGISLAFIFMYLQVIRPEKGEII